MTSALGRRAHPSTDPEPGRREGEEERYWSASFVRTLFGKLLNELDHVAIWPVVS